jgi:preprotein translocase subunit SecB
MADDTEGPQGNGSESAAAPDAKTEQAAEPRLILNSHYIKDLSFENPNAPVIYGELQKGPTIDMHIDVASSRVQERVFEVLLKLRVTAKVEDKLAFLVELDMAGLATIGQGVADDERERLLFIEVPRYLFPFARAVIGDMTRDGGFPPLLMNPISFEELYRSQKEQAAQPAEATA